MRLPHGGWEFGLRPETINNFRQNSPELILRDARRMLGLDEAQCDKLRDILMARGVNKWFAARRGVIRYKEELRAEIKDVMEHYDRRYHRAYLACLARVRGRLRKICHMPRWVEWPPIADASKAERDLVIRGPES